MALKDWKKYKGRLVWKKEGIGKNPDMSITIDKLHLVGHRVSYYLQAGKVGHFLDTSGNFKTKSQALKFAREYKRRH